jgi:hypothetical protein
MPLVLERVANHISKEKCVRAGESLLAGVLLGYKVGLYALREFVPSRVSLIIDVKIQVFVTAALVAGKSMSIVHLLPLSMRVKVTRFQ